MRPHFDVRASANDGRLIIDPQAIVASERQPNVEHEVAEVVVARLERADYKFVRHQNISIATHWPKSEPLVSGKTI